jgi:hypothetical protein
MQVPLIGKFVREVVVATAFCRPVATTIKDKSKLPSLPSLKHKSDPQKIMKLMMMQTNSANNSVINQTNIRLCCSLTCLVIIALLATYGNLELLLHA